MLSKFSDTQLEVRVPLIRIHMHVRPRRTVTLRAHSVPEVCQ